MLLVVWVQMDIKRIINRWRIEIILIFYFVVLYAYNPAWPTGVHIFWLSALVAVTLFLWFFPLIFFREETMQKQRKLISQYYPNGVTISRRTKILVNVILLVLITFLFLRSLILQGIIDL
ncbi:MAG: hypothetical protein D6732_02050 [Methanobacteriota archaeon]|nr:MAG: hypothetical protein D6732_02050 [Euryarchaeota archaeon]